MIGYPLLLEPQYDEKVWGGRRLERVLGKPLPPDVAVGESLESGTTAVIGNGPFAGQTIGRLVAQLPTALLGSCGLAASRPFNDFPLLAKFIDASDVLSIQVHPDDDGAAPLHQRGKTEAWYILAAEPGAELITGMRPGVTPADAHRAIADGTFDKLVERRTVTAGDCLIVPAGAVHAIGAGILLYEIQETCDITFRLYDWNRRDPSGQGRPLHVSEALRAMKVDRHATPVAPLALDAHRTVLAACRYFALERWMVSGTLSFPSTRGRTFRLLSCIEGDAQLQVPGRPSVALARGRTALLPADVASAAITAEAAGVLSVTVPDLSEDIVEPLQHAGYHADQIARLDGGIGDIAAVLAADGPTPITPPA